MMEFSPEANERIRTFWKLILEAPDDADLPKIIHEHMPEMAERWERDGTMDRIRKAGEDDAKRPG